MISLLSPQKKWEQNKEDVIKVLNNETSGIFSTARTLNECKLLIDGLFMIPESRLKTYAFAECILYAGNCNHVVIDRHAIKIAYGEMSAKEIGITPKRYRDAVEAYNIVADRYNLSGSEIQAITWVTYKRIVNR